MESPDNHRYSTADYFNVDPYLGTNDDFKELCELFKKHGIHIILDGVFSHTGDDSIYFNKQGHYESNGAFNSINSPYYSWFNFMHYPDTYHSWWGFSNLPTVNKLNKSYMDFINNPSDGVLPFWQHLGISGWRLDVADEFPDEFLDELRTTVKKTDSEALIIGEVWEDATTKVAYDRRRKYFLGEQLDSVMNYPWKNAIIEFIKTKDASALKYALEEIIITPYKLTGYLAIDAKYIPVNSQLQYRISGLNMGYESRGNSSPSIVGKVLGAISDPAGFLYKTFSSKAKDLKKLKKMKENDEIRNLLLTKYDRETLSQMLNIDKIELEDVLRHCNYSKEFIKEANDLQFLEALSNCYDEYKILKK